MILQREVARFVMLVKCVEAASCVWETRAVVKTAWLVRCVTPARTVYRTRAVVSSVWLVRPVIHHNPVHPVSLVRFVLSVKVATRGRGVVRYV